MPVLSNVSAEVEAALQKNSGDVAKGMCDFVEGELEYFLMGETTGIVYLPVAPMNGRWKGKIILECSRADKRIKNQSKSMYFEFQLSRSNSFEGATRQILRDDNWEGVYRYYNMFLSTYEAEDVVQALLFSGLFARKFLMTSEGCALESMSTQRLRSPSGNVFSFRQCALNE